MSSLSISGVGQSLFQYLQGLSSQTQSPESEATVTSNGTVTATQATPPPDGGTGEAQGTHHHHHGHGGGGGFSKIQDAVTSALQTAQADPTADPNKVIEQAITKVFQQNGAGQTDGAAQATADGNASAQSSGQVTQNADTATARQEFFQTLQSLGVTPQQFQQDFAAAIKDAQNGQADPSTALASFPPGSNVDTTG